MQLEDHSNFLALGDIRLEGFRISGTDLNSS